MIQLSPVTPEDVFRIGGRCDSVFQNADQGDPQFLQAFVFSGVDLLFFSGAVIIGSVIFDAQFIIRKIEINFQMFLYLIAIIHGCT